MISAKKIKIIVLFFSLVVCFEVFIKADVVDILEKMSIRQKVCLASALARVPLMTFVSTASYEHERDLKCLCATLADGARLAGTISALDRFERDGYWYALASCGVDGVSLLDNMMFGYFEQDDGDSSYIDQEDEQRYFDWTQIKFGLLEGVFAGLHLLCDKLDQGVARPHRPHLCAFLFSLERFCRCAGEYSKKQESVSWHWGTGASAMAVVYFLAKFMRHGGEEGGRCIELGKKTESCPICLGGFIEQQQTGVKFKYHVAKETVHVFCNDCIEQAVAAKDECPLCRVESQQYTQLQADAFFERDGRLFVDIE
ncbi:MAG: hypothetical protein H6679_01710 [Epsilonproteobacteria bacterium]|nr:hypothetical protein [Campylobacterota bacterium]